MSVVTVVDIRAEPYGGPAAEALVAELQAEYVVRYGGPDETPVDPDDFDPPGGGFLVVYVGDEAVGSGGYRWVADGTVEIKRMYVKPSWRGRGLARQLLAALEQAALDRGCSQVRLMTGPEQPEAIRLYESSGYLPADPYGVYSCAPGARFFGKQLMAGAG